MLTDTHVVWRLFLAAALGGIIGFEREKHNRRIAGLRTHILVSIGSALIMLVSIYIFEIYAGRAPVDPARIAAGVVTGIGFLGAGTIFRAKDHVTGLTTAASLWAVAAVGLSIAVGLYLISFVSVILILIILQLNKIAYFREL